MSEQDVQAKIIKYIIASGGYTVKIITASKAGVPDILCCYKGKFIGIEVKVKGNKPSELQKHNLLCIEEAGGFGLVAYSVLEVKNFLAKFD